MMQTNCCAEPVEATGGHRAALVVSVDFKRYRQSDRIWRLEQVIGGRLLVAVWSRGGVGCWWQNGWEEEYVVGCWWQSGQRGGREAFTDERGRHLQMKEQHHGRRRRHS